MFKNLLIGLISSITAVSYIVLVVFLFAAILAWPVEWLWNNTLPALFEFKTIDFWAAMRILFLTGLLFRSSSSSK